MIERKEKKEREEPNAKVIKGKVIDIFPPFVNCSPVFYFCFLFFIFCFLFFVFCFLFFVFCFLFFVFCFLFFVFCFLVGKRERMRKRKERKRKKKKKKKKKSHETAHRSNHVLYNISYYLEYAHYLHIYTSNTYKPKNLNSTSPHKEEYLEKKEVRREGRRERKEKKRKEKKRKEKKRKEKKRKEKKRKEKKERNQKKEGHNKSLGYWVTPIGEKKKKKLVNSFPFPLSSLSPLPSLPLFFPFSFPLSYLKGGGVRINDCCACHSVFSHVL